ncbi:MAG: YggU family protein, partial [Gammaproteobacteria bacterium]
MGWHRWEGEDLILELRVQPRASRSEVQGPQGGRLRVRLTAPPVEGQANEALRRLLAEAFRVPLSAVSVERGQGGREKRVRVHAPRRLPSWTSCRPCGAPPP